MNIWYKLRKKEKHYPQLSGYLGNSPTAKWVEELNNPDLTLIKDIAVFNPRNKR